MSETAIDKKDSAKLEEACIRVALLEAYTADPEQVVSRREQLESLSFLDLDGQQSTAIYKLHKKLKQDERAVKIDPRTGTYDDWQLSLPPIGGLGVVTILAGEGFQSAGVVKIFTGEASDLLVTEPGLVKADYVNGVLIADRNGGNNVDVWRRTAKSSIKDMQHTVENILLLEALAEQLNTDTNSALATQAGEIAVRAERS